MRTPDTNDITDSNDNHVIDSCFKQGVPPTPSGQMRYIPQSVVVTKSNHGLIRAQLRAKGLENVRTI